MKSLIALLWILYKDDNNPKLSYLLANLKSGKIMYLDVHFDNCLAYHCGTKERPKWYKEMSARNAGKIKQRIWYLYIIYKHIKAYTYDFDKHVPQRKKVIDVSMHNYKGHISKCFKSSRYSETKIVCFPP